MTPNCSQPPRQRKMRMDVDDGSEALVARDSQIGKRLSEFTRPLPALAHVLSRMRLASNILFPRFHPTRRCHATESEGDVHTEYT
jgi:hypothetical protein